MTFNTGLNMMLHVWNRRRPTQDLNPRLGLKAVVIILEPFFYSIDRCLHTTKQYPETLIISLPLDAHSFEVKLSIFLVLGVYKDSVPLNP